MIGAILMFGGGWLLNACGRAFDRIYLALAGLIVMLVALAIAVVSFGLSGGHRQEADSVEPDLMPEYYDTLVEAATAGIQVAYDRSNVYEYGGVILRTTNGKFRTALPDTNYRGDGVHIDYSNDYAGYEVVADYHTHPCLPYSHWPAVFSDGDVTSNDVRDLVAYMGDLCSGVIREYVPGVTPRDMCWQHSEEVKALAALAGYNLCGAHGKEVGSIKITRSPVVQEIPGPNTRARGVNCW